MSPEERNQASATTEVRRLRGAAKVPACGFTKAGTQVPQAQREVADRDEQGSLEPLNRGGVREGLDVSR